MDLLSLNLGKFILMRKEVQAILNNVKCHLLFATWLGCLSWVVLADQEIVLNQLYKPGSIWYIKRDF